MTREAHDVAAERGDADRRRRRSSRPSRHDRARRARKLASTMRERDRRARGAVASRGRGRRRATTTGADDQPALHDVDRDVALYWPALSRPRLPLLFACHLAPGTGSRRARETPTTPSSAEHDREQRAGPEAAVEPPADEREEQRRERRARRRARGRRRTPATSPAGPGVPPCCKPLRNFPPARRRCSRAVPEDCL